MRWCLTVRAVLGRGGRVCWMGVQGSGRKSLIVRDGCRGMLYDKVWHGELFGTSYHSPSTNAAWLHTTGVPQSCDAATHSLYTVAGELT